MADSAKEALRKFGSLPNTVIKRDLIAVNA
jgi:hypothetical protein